jgi:ubiquitin conjugation factor E4 B
LLTRLAQTYTNMLDQSEFIKAVGTDGRSFKPAVLKRASSLTGSSGLVKLLEKVSALAISGATEGEAEDDSATVDVPEEFLDQLMFTVMEDPVLLPSSKTILDRSTIIAHLLNSATDPFNRSPLQIDELIPEIELKAKIDRWKAAKRNK